MAIKQNLIKLGKRIGNSTYQPFGLYRAKKEEMRENIIDYLTNVDEANMETDDAEYVADNALKFLKRKNTAEAETSSMMIRNGATVGEAETYSKGVKDLIAKKTAVADAVGLGIVEVGGIVFGVYLLKEGPDFISDNNFVRGSANYLSDKMSGIGSYFSGLGGEGEAPPAGPGVTTAVAGALGSNGNEAQTAETLYNETVNNLSAVIEANLTDANFSNPLAQVNGSTGTASAGADSVTLKEGTIKFSAQS